MTKRKRTGAGRTRATAWAVALVLATAALAGAAPAQVLPLGSGGSKDTADATPPPSEPEALKAEREKIAATLEELRQKVAAGETPAELVERIETLERLDRTLSSHLEALDTLKTLREEAANPTSGRASLISADPPYPFALYEATSQALAQHRKQTAVVKERAEAERREAERLADDRDKADRERRRIRDAVEQASDPVEKARLSDELRRAELAARLANAEYARRHTAAEVAQAELEGHEARTRLLEATLEHLRSRVVVSRYDLDEPFNRLALEEERARAEIDRTKTDLVAAERRIAEVQQRLDAQTDPSPALRAELEARRRQRQVAQARIARLEARLDQLATQREVWRQRLDVLAGADREQALEWSKAIEDELDRLRRAERLAASRKADLAQERERIAALAESPDASASPWIQEQLAAAETLEAIHAKTEADLAQTRDFLSRALWDFGDAAGEGSWLARLRSGLSRGGELWDREVFVVDDRSITVGKITLALVLFVLGFSVSRALARVFGSMVYRRVLDAGAADAFQSLTFYGLLVAFFLIALRTVNIPLTAFALLGGALAIGLGFGSQNVIGNFISGLILLVERPIKVGDIVDVEGVSGVIERVGPRSTRIRTFDNLHIIVPNSMLLEQKVVNWTLSDDTIRRTITVGIAYESAVRDAVKLIQRAVDEHGKVLTKPPPRIFFQEFGDSALLFRIDIWMRLDGASFLEIESDLRHRIFHLFREGGVTISFPQRDVHFDASAPIEVRMLPPSGPDEA